MYLVPDLVITWGSVPLFSMTSTLLALRTAVLHALETADSVQIPLASSLCEMMFANVSTFSASRVIFGMNCLVISKWSLRFCKYAGHSRP